MSETAVADLSTGIERPRRPLRIWREVIYTAAFYGLYWLVRNGQGSARDAHRQALTNAHRIIRWERWVGMFHEESMQEVFLRSKVFIQSLNVWYAVAHFVVTIAAMVWCFRVMPHRYAAMRNGLAFMTGLALIGFAFYPLLPPRLLPMHYGFVDTLKVFGGPWSFESGPVAKVSNQYAAMPSLHFGWSSWCTVVFWPWARTSWRRVLVITYPVITLFAIVVTANHYILDAVAGLIVFVVGWRLGHALDRTGIEELWRRFSARSGRRFRTSSSRRR